MSRRKENIFINPENLTTVAGLFNQRNEAFEAALDTYVHMYNRSQISLKASGFTTQELIALVSMYNGTILERRFSFKPYVITHIEDAERYEGSCSKNGADKDQLIRKISEIDDMTLFFLIEEIYRFWFVESAYGYPTPRLEEFLKKYAAAP